MKTNAIVPATMVLFASLSSTALAANGTRTDNSSLVVWLFLGFCALIVVAQLLPLIRTTRLAAQAKREQGAESGAIPATVSLSEAPELEKKRG